ncbi:hypothetical protein SLA_6407 [Streptomyces laurentii]|uniref:Uncharacterized protein n=1 Tax=Streptomyces laurentii TaxID=39478 RepID=A0A160P7Y9_STRLU|nr:hypothetical protein SLA_6407 [Streptomyces laurentii]
MLSVVDGEVAAAEREREAAEPGPAFEQGDPHAGLGQSKRAGDAGEPAADDDGVRAAVTRGCRAGGTLGAAGVVCGHAVSSREFPGSPGPPAAAGSRSGAFPTPERDAEAAARVARAGLTRAS